MQPLQQHSVAQAPSHLRKSVPGLQVQQSKLHLGKPWLPQGSSRSYYIVMLRRTDMKLHKGTSNWTGMFFCSALWRWCILEVIKYAQVSRHWLQQVNVMKKKFMLYCPRLLFGPWGSQNPESFRYPDSTRTQGWAHYPRTAPWPRVGKEREGLWEERRPFYQTSCHARDEQWAFQHTSL